MKLSDFADMVEKMETQVKEMDFLDTPNFKFKTALSETLVNNHSLDKKMADKIAGSMAVDISWFDAANPDWNRVLTTYAKMIVNIGEKVKKSTLSDSMKEGLENQLLNGISIKWEFPEPNALRKHRM